MNLAAIHVEGDDNERILDESPVDIEFFNFCFSLPFIADIPLFH